jgi:hypothetical protein
MLTVTAARAKLTPYLPPPPVVVPFDPRPYVQRLEQIARDYGWKIHACPAGEGRARGPHKGVTDIYMPWPPRTEAEVAECAHEIGHGLQPPCTKRDPHYEDREHRSFACLGCETSAWALAVAVIEPLEWTAGMHERLQWGLASYRRTTKGWPAAIAQLDGLSRPVMRFVLKQRALEKRLGRATTLRRR